MLISLVKKYPVAFLMLISGCMLLPHLGLLQTNIMEARNLITAREMVQNHEWIFTTINGNPRYEKPPLPTWLTAAAGSIFGFNDLFWLRLPAALVTLMLVYFFYLLLKSSGFSLRQRFNSWLVLTTSFYIFFSGRDNQWDIYTHAFMMGGIYYFFLLMQHPQKTLRYLLPAGLFFGLSFLCKGPVSPYALFLPFVIAYFIVYKNSLTPGVIKVLGILIIGLAIGLSWPLYVRFFDAANFQSATAKEAGRWGSYNIRPFWYYWSFFTQSGVWTIAAFAALLYPFMNKRVSDKKLYLLSFLWTIFSVLLLSFIPEKKARYLLPVLIPLAMNTGFYIEYLIRNLKNIRSRLENIFINISFGLPGVIAVAAPVAIALLLKERAADYIFWITGLSLACFCCAWFILRGLIKRNFSKVFYAIVAMMCALVIFVFPITKAYYSNPRYYAATNLHKIEQEENIHSFEVNGFTPEIIWDYKGTIPELMIDGQPKNITDTTFGLLVSSEDEDSCRIKMRGYSFKKLATVDLNNVAPGNKQYNARLTRSYFLVKKADTSIHVPL